MMEISIHEEIHRVKRLLHKKPVKCSRCEHIDNLDVDMKLDEYENIYKIQLECPICGTKKKTFIFELY